MNNDSPFTTIGDEPVEARIVAWVLGEASAFEAAELERLCDERPELLVFRRRIRALHGLLTEAEAAQPDEGWKLPAEKRQALDEIYVDEKVVPLDVEKENRIRRSGRRTFLSIAACLVLTVVILGMMAPMVVRQRKKADVKESAMSVTYSAMLDEPPSDETGPPAGSLVPLATDLPKDLIEGTPKPMNVPNLEAPVSGPAGSNSWSRGRFAETADKSGERAEQPGSSAPNPSEPVVGLRSGDQAINRNSIDAILNNPNRTEPAAPPSMPSPLVANQPEPRISGTENQELRYRGTTTPPPPPARPSSSMARTITGTTSSPTGAPVPNGRTEDQLSALGESDDFGNGWGSAKRPADRQTADGGIVLKSEAAAEMPAPAPVAAEPTLDGKKDRSSVDAIPQITTRSIDLPMAGKPAAEGEILNGVVSGGAVLDLSTNESLAKGQAAAGGFGGGGGGSASAGPPELGALFAESNRSAGAKEKKLAESRTQLRDDGTEHAMELRKVGKYTEARDQLEKVLTADPNNSDARRELDYLDDPVRANPALTYEHGKNVDDVRRKLYMAEGNYNLGKYDDAKREYENTLRIDPYNSAARRGLERVASAKSDYYRAAYDHTRSELLSQVDAAWELSVPADANAPVAEQDAGPGIVDRFATYTGFRQSALGLDASVGDQQRRLGEQAAAASAFSLNGPDSKLGAPMFNDLWDASAADESAGRSGEVKSEIHAGRSSKYFFNGADLAVGDKPALPTADFEGFGNFGRPMATGEPQVPGQAGLNVVREFQYPTEYAAPEKPNSASGPGGVPVTPATPTAWMTRDEGTKADVSKLAESEVIRRKVVNPDAESLLSNEERQAISKSLSMEADFSEVLKKCEELLKLDPDNSEALEALRILQESQVEVRVPQQKVELPKPNLADLMQEIAASEDPYSTFSLNISDASFKIAQAALAKGERPDPAGIKVEQFYNAVDYGDPAPSAGEPVAVAIEQSAHPVIPGRNLVRVALKTAAAGRSASQPLRLTLLVDQSGSMVREDRRAAMEKALAGLTGLLTKDDLVTVIGFSRTPRLLADGMSGDQAAKLKDLVNQSASEGGTNLEEAIKLAEQLADRRKLAGAQNRIVLFTDGAANLGNADPVRLAEKVKELRQKGIAFDIAGIAADGLNDELLGELARNGNGRYYVVGKGADENFAKQLAGAFRPAAENVKVQVRFNPERVGHYKLIGFEKDRLKTEDFRNDAVDAAELAAEEAGVAIYQVETLPAGKGELGEVSVRFRDAASGQMVERTWTVPHDGGAPAIDRATPSMQLAALAMLAAEKLKGGPLAEAIDFKQLADPQANVKRFYGTNGRAGEILNMVDALK
jgi:Mg-chelatase subunit ChlD